MKQHITEEQLNELSEKAKDRYNHWYKDKGYLSKVDDNGWFVFIPSSLLSIGQMIEFLDDFHLAMDVVKISWLPNMDFRNLCDDLWIAVKERLEYQSLYVKNDDEGDEEQYRLSKKLEGSL